MDNKFQHDFFGDHNREGDPRKLGFLSKYSKHRLLPHLRVPIEYVVVAGIVMLVLVIIAYAIGVERGKRVQLGKGQDRAVTKTQVVVNKDVTVKPSVRPVVKSPAKVSVSNYMVQLASFRDLKMAKQEAEKLRKKGYSVSYKKSGTWYQIYAEGYRSMDDAEKAKKELAKYYKDCYIRKVK